MKLSFATRVCSIRAVPTVLCLLFLSSVAAAQHSRECPLEPSQYARGEYQIKAIKVETPLQFFGQVKSKVAEINANLATPGNYRNPEAREHPLREGARFNV